VTSLAIRLPQTGDFRRSEISGELRFFRASHDAFAGAPEMCDEGHKRQGWPLDYLLEKEAM